MTDLSIEALRLAAYDLLAGRVADGTALAKHALAEGMTVTDRKAVVVPVDGESVKVATVSCVEGRRGKNEAVIDDPAAFTEWAEQNHPEAVYTAKHVKEWLIGEALHRAERGELIPGVEVIEHDPGRPYIRIQRDKTTEGEAALVDAIFQQGLAGVRSLLALPSSPSQTGDSSK